MSKNQKLLKSKSDNQFKNIILGVQFLFVAFGATVLVPLLVGIDPAVALFTAGVGTLIFHLITKGRVPVFLGSSFVFIAPIIAATEKYGMPGALSGLIAVGVVYTVVSFIVKKWGIKVVEKIFPPIVVGPVIIVIGLSLASVAVDMAKGNWLIAIIALVTAIVIVVFTKGMIKLIPIFCGLLAGFIAAILMGNVDFAPIADAKWIALPGFIRPEFNWNAIVFMLPVALAPIIEHIGDMYAISNVAKKDFVHDPGLHRTILGDGIATAFAGFFGGPPNTTYSEVTGAIALTKITNPKILRITAVTAIVFSLVGKISAFLKIIPAYVLGGIMLLLFGMIASIGIRTMIDSKVDFNATRNQVIASVILTVGVGGAAISWGSFSMGGIGLASLVGVLLNIVIPSKER